MSAGRTHQVEDEMEARQERIYRLLSELRASVDRKKAVVEQWRREGLLPPEEPRRRF